MSGLTPKENGASRSVGKVDAPAGNRDRVIVKNSDSRKSLTTTQRNALSLLRDLERQIGHPLEPGDAGVYTETWHDSYTVGIHHRTAEALARRGLVTIDGSNCLPGEPSDLFLTDAGRSA